MDIQAMVISRIMGALMIGPLLQKNKQRLNYILEEDLSVLVGAAGQASVSCGSQAAGPAVVSVSCYSVGPF